MLDERIRSLSDLIARKHYRYRANSENYRYGIQFISAHLYSLVFKLCENAVREQYGNKRKLSTNTSYSEELSLYIEDALLARADGVISSKISAIEPPDAATGIMLNASNTTRWKLAFEKMIGGPEAWTGQDFVLEVMQFGEQNKRNPSIENIFFEASKYIAKIDKQAALTLYIHYLYHDLKSAKFDNKKLTKTIQKNLFATHDQLQRFERIVSDLVNNKDLGKALADVPSVYAVIRKQIRLDHGQIQDVRHKHSETVDLLNEYLQDDVEEDQIAISVKGDEIQIEISSYVEEESSQTLIVVDLSTVQKKILEMFEKNSFTVSQADLERFARENGAFKNQVIESINEACYEILDDVLIEEDDDLYIVNEDYYRMIIKT